jgi:hypothetical protein
VIRLPQVDQEVIFSILNGMGIPLPQFFREDGTPVKMSGNVAPWFELKDSNIMQQTDIQRRFQKSIQTHSSAVAIANGVVNGPWIDTNGFNEVIASLSNDAAVNSQIHFHWSNDGVSIHSLEMTANNALQNYSAVSATKLRWVRPVFKNMDGAAPHTMNGFLYLKV